MRVFSTVGTTRFEALNRALLSDKVLECLYERGVREMSMQTGTFDVNSAVERLYEAPYVMTNDDVSLFVSHNIKVGS